MTLRIIHSRLAPSWVSSAPFQPVCFVPKLIVLWLRSLVIHTWVIGYIYLWHQFMTALQRLCPENRRELRCSLYRWRDEFEIISSPICYYCNKSSPYIHLGTWEYLRHTTCVSNRFCSFRFIQDSVLHGTWEERYGSDCWKGGSGMRVLQLWQNTLKLWPTQ